MELVYAISHYY